MYKKMGDMYHHTMATQIASQLGQQVLDMNEARLTNWSTKTLLYNQKTSQDQANEKTDLYREVESDIVKVPTLAKTTAVAGRAVRALGVGAYRGMSQGEGAANALARGGRGMTAELSRAGEAMGSRIFTTARFGEGIDVAKMTGTEGIIGKNLLEAGAGEAFAKVAAKSVAGLGFGISAIGDAENLWQTGNIFNTKNADGTTQKATLGEDVGNVASLLGGALDIAAAFTGGALAPVAAAVNIAAAATSTIEEQKADEAQKSTDSKDVPPSKPPPSVVSAAFTQLGLQANMSHNPLQHIG
jgi:hypothetical protein